MSTTPQDLDLVTEIDPEDIVMTTHSDESTECIKGQKLKKDIGGISYIPTCTTAINLSEKSVTGPKITLEAGVTIEVCFSNGNSSQTPTLNYNNTGAKAIKIYLAGNKIDAVLSQMDAGIIMRLRYDGTDWVIVGNPVVAQNTSSSSGYTIYADGTSVYNRSTIDQKNNFNTVYVADLNDAKPTGSTLFCAWQSSYQPRNNPAWDANYWSGVTIASPAGNNYYLQLAMSLGATCYIRACNGGSWTSWTKL